MEIRFTAPDDGEFILVQHISPARCPACGEFKANLWHFTKPESSIVRAVCCEECAGSEEKAA